MNGWPPTWRDASDTVESLEPPSRGDPAPESESPPDEPLLLAGPLLEELLLAGPPLDEPLPEPSALPVLEELPSAPPASAGPAPSDDEQAANPPSPIASTAVVHAPFAVMRFAWRLDRLDGAPLVGV